MGGRVVDYIVGELASRGTGFVFGVDGANIEDLFDALHGRPEITGVLAKHEFAAAAMAYGYSRAGAGVGVVAATSGGGALNLIAGLGESYASRMPALALVGQAPTALDGHGAFQDTSGHGGSLDAVRLFSAVSVYCRRVANPADIGVLLAEALDAAQHRRKEFVALGARNCGRRCGMKGPCPLRRNPTRSRWRARTGSAPGGATSPTGWSPSPR
jgi:acetolactate synthase-1/2/3 large subunit